MPTHIIGLTYKTDAGTVPVSPVPFTVDTEIFEELLVPAGAVNKEFDVQFAFATINDYCIHLLNATTKAEATAGTVLLKFNSTGTPAPLVTQVAKVATMHAPGFGTTSVFAANVTKVYASNAGIVDLRVALHVGMNVAV